MIRSLCGAYALTLAPGCGLNETESFRIRAAIDSALIRIRGESETAKRARESNELNTRLKDEAS